MGQKSQIHSAFDTFESMNKLKQFALDNSYSLLFIIIAIGYLCNMTLNVMDVDASQYASIAMEMWENKSFLQVYHRGNDYLDKPPLLFWLSSLSMGLFGLNNFAYKLPSVLILILGIYSTFRLGSRMWNREVGLKAALLLACTNAFFLVSNDVRTDGMLSGLVIFTVWQLYEFLQDKRWQAFLLAALGAGLAMLTKGPVAIGIVGLGLGAHLILKKQWKEIFHLRWILFLLIVLLILSPMLWGLYQQFDLHPEKEVYGLQGPSGILFYFYTQSFGRLTGDIYWNNHTGPFFFLGSMMWDYQPIALVFLIALFHRITGWIQGDKPKEYLSMFAVILPFVALSMSKYKLPHYIFPLLPFAVLHAVSWIEANPNGKLRKTAIIIQKSIVALYPVIAVLAFYLFFTPDNPWLMLAIIPVTLAIWYYKTGGYWAQSLAAMSVTLLLVTSLYFYPSLEPYQSTSLAGKALKESNAPYKAQLNAHGHSLDFYAQEILPSFDSSTVDTWAMVYTDDKGWDKLQSSFPKSEVFESYCHYHITTLKPKFLLKSSRNEQCKPRYLIKVQR